MKKVIALALAVMAVAVCLAACGGEPKVSVYYFDSDRFADEDWDQAKKVVEDYFKNFEGCEMEVMEYAGDDASAEEAKAQGMDENCVMVINSTFTTDGENHENGLEPNHTYKDYKWIIVRQSEDDPWEHKDHGYG